MRWKCQRHLEWFFIFYFVPFHVSLKCFKLAYAFTIHMRQIYLQIYFFFLCCKRVCIGIRHALNQNSQWCHTHTQYVLKGEIFFTLFLIATFFLFLSFVSSASSITLMNKKPMDCCHYNHFVRLLAKRSFVLSVKSLYFFFSFFFCKRKENHPQLGKISTSAHSCCYRCSYSYFYIYLELFQFYHFSFVPFYIH